MVDFSKIVDKWMHKWNEFHVYEANANPSKPKFFLTFPYPYMNGYLHVGHFFTLMRVDAFARYKRMQGFNVLFPQGWHCTGSPIENAAQRIREKEETQIQLMKQAGFSDEEIKKFEEPKYWTEYFPKESEKDYRRMGLSVDFRRSFITTDLNPHYDKFIRWQFKILKEKGYIAKGKHPVVWCLKDNSPVGDHARVKGEGETPQEYVLMKYKFEDSYLVAATLRPETIFGDTNIWVNPNIDYVKAKVNDEIWIMSSECAVKLREQEKNVEIIGKISGKDMLGKYCTTPMTKESIIILPASFCDPKLGTGIVRSVPAHAPPDWMGLYDLQKNREAIEKYGLNSHEVMKIKPISMISIEGYSDFPAVEICQRMKIKDQNDPKLEEATKEIYKKEHYTGKMKANCGRFADMGVEDAKNIVKEEMIKNREADIMYDLTGEVICRCLTPSIVKIVSDQWFIRYSDKEWKKLAHKCLDKMKLYPEKSRQQFEYVLDWLNDWACTRELGLGTRLPWDEKWVIESLSDSTIYMSYYTIAHLLQDIKAEHVTEDIFNYVFLGKGLKPKIKHIDAMKQEFEYWYPVDFRNSGKDLIQNHLSFFIFNHVAIFPEKHWPQGIGTNGWVTVDGQKMSKSLGNVILLRELAERFSPDASRITILSGGEGLDDANWDSELARNMKAKLERFYEFCLEHYNKGTRAKREIDSWFESELNEIIKDATQYMEETMFRSALQRSFFDLQRIIKWYLKRTAGKPNLELMNKSIQTQILLIAPFAPFICEEIWEKINRKGFISLAKWPSFDAHKINPELKESEEIMERTVDDVRAILGILKITRPQQISLVIAEPWKYEFFDMASKEIGQTRDFPVLMKEILKHDRFKPYAKEIPQMLQKLLKSGVPKGLTSHEKELKSLQDSKEFLEKEFQCEIVIEKAEDSRHEKAKQALPTKPAIIIK
jgi:leucyl-tRNA synthetase